MSGKKKETYVYGSLKERFAAEWKIFALAFVFILITGSTGQAKIPVGKGMLIPFPVLYVIILGMLSDPQVLKITSSKQVKAVSKPVVAGICPFIAKLGITAGTSIGITLQSGSVLLFHGFGNLLGPLLALPIAIPLEMKREAVGACHSVNRECHMALVNSIYGLDLAEAGGNLPICIVGGMVGTIYFGLMTPVTSMTGWSHPQALGLAPGVRAGIMMVNSSTSLYAIYPSWVETIPAMASAGETTARITGMYITMSVIIPMTDKLYWIPEPKLGRFALKSKEIKEETVRDV